MKDEQNRIPPQSLETEAAILGALMIDSSAMERIIDNINVDDFFKESHRHIFYVMRQLDTIDILTVSEKLKSEGLLRNIDITYYLTECISQVTTSANIEKHVRIIREKAIQRNIINGLELILQNAWFERKQAIENVEDVEKLLTEINVDNNSNDGIKTLEDIMHEVISYGVNSSEVNIKSHIWELDKKTGGFVSGESIIIAGKTSMGKTSLAVQIFLDNFKRNIVGGFISLESSGVQIGRRIVSNLSGYSVTNIKEPMDDSYMIKITEVCSDLSKMKGVIYDGDRRDIRNVVRIARLMKRKYKVNFIIIDYLQRIFIKAESKRVQISEISSIIKSLAKELNIPVLTLCQLSRDPKHIAQKEPVLSDLKESGDIENDADKVLFVHRPAYFQQEGRDKIIIAKNRDGDTGYIELDFEPKSMKFN